MKKAFLISLLLYRVLFVFAQRDLKDTPGMKMNELKSQPVNKPEIKSNPNNESVKVIYTCVMHPEVKMNKPGNCPKCGMKLIKKTVKVSKNQSTDSGSPYNLVKDTMQINGKVQASNEIQNIPKNEQSKNDNSEKERFLETETQKVIIGQGKTIRYDLYVSDTTVNFTGKVKHAYAINGSIPAPTLVFTEGDTAEIYLHNILKSEETSLHWHGVILPNEADGVPYLTTAPIKPGDTHLYKFAIVQNGTYWYHSHSKLQEQAGLYGALVFNKRQISFGLESTKDSVTQIGSGVSNGEMKDKLFSAEYPLVLSEWTDEKPREVQRRLRAANDWYAIKKGSTQSYFESIRQGYFKTKVSNEWKRMKAMDVSDVYYDRFLINGQSENSATQFKTGDKIRLRVINAGASSYFWLQYAGGKITVIANDGNNVEPVEVDRLIIGVSETYDVVVTVPGNMSYEFRATPEDRTNSASLWLGTGIKKPAIVLPKLRYFEGMKMMNGMMKMNGDVKVMAGMEMRNQAMDMNTVMYPEITGTVIPESNSINRKMATLQHHKERKESHNSTQNDKEWVVSNNTETITLNYGMLRSPLKTVLPDVPTKELHFTLTGNMNRYVWGINGKTVNKSEKILIEHGKNVRIILFNNSMMRHPMHLHGHDFRVLNGQGEYAPYKNVLDIMPMETDTIEFAGNQNGNWFFHCHILYHMMAGMGNVFTYINSPINPELPDALKAYKQFKRENHMFHFTGKAGLENNGTDGEFMFEGNEYHLQQMWHIGFHDEHGYESETNLGRYIGRMQWWFPYIGFDYHYKKEGMHHKNIFGDDKYNLLGQLSNKNNRKTIVAGVQYTLPMLIVADSRIDASGKFRFQLSREDVPVTNRLRFNFMINTDKEYAAGLRFIIKRWFALSTHYDSDMGPGIGVTLTY
ncbi:MAG: multicopper oxidase domain-containing protein [Ginsengibacter sp.]